MSSNSEGRLPARYAIIRLSSLGDIVHTVPAVHFLKLKQPKSHITWFAEPAGAELLRLFDGIDHIESVRLKVPGLSNRLAELRRIRAEYHNHFDTVMDFQGLIKSAMLSGLLGGDRVGFRSRNLREPFARIFYSRTVREFPEDNHVIHKNLHLMEQVLQERAPGVSYPLKSFSPSPALRDFFSAKGLTKKGFAVLNVGGGWETKILADHLYITVARRLRRLCPVVIIWGNAEEKIRAEKVARAADVLLSGFLGFSDLAHLLEQACFLISADTLALHMADMVSTPSIGIFGPTSPDRNGSLLSDSRAIIQDVECRTCYRKQCGIDLCTNTVDIAKIFHEAKTLHATCHRSIH